LACALTAFATARCVRASRINIPNFSFEADQVPPNTVVQGNANWISVAGASGGDFGRFHAGGAFSQPAFPTDGTQVAFLGSALGHGYQYLTGTHTMGVYYELHVDV